MKRYLLSIQQPDAAPPPSVDMDRIAREVASLEQEMKAAGAWVFNDHLSPPSAAIVVQVRDGDVVVTDGPYAAGKEHVGGVSIVNAPDLDAALEWGRKLARVLAPLAVEVRPFQREADDNPM